ncbi:hypothetical protein LguiA_006429 [Lonicera macranthoides]
MADLPVDIFISHIFVRLPFKSLLTCKCVCKFWLGLLKDPEFIKMHVKDQSQSHQKFLLGPIIFNIRYRYRNCYRDKDYLAKLDAFNGVFYSVDLEPSSSTAHAMRLQGFSLEDFFINRILGNCNGMICAEVVRKWTTDYYKDRHLLFGNPSTGVYKILPKPIIVVGPQIVGFAFDSSLDDYKFLIVDRISRNPYIYSLKLNSWRIVRRAKYPIKMDNLNNKGFAIDGIIYWLVSSSNTIVWFDLKDEEFGELPLPCDMRNNKLLCSNVIGGSLCIISIFKNNKAQVWSVLKEEENNNNKEKYYWIMLTKVTISAKIFGRVFEIDPLSFLKGGKVLCCLRDFNGSNLVNDMIKYVLIDPKTKKLEDFSIHGICPFLFRDYTFQQQTTYIDTLVSPN